MAYIPEKKLAGKVAVVTGGARGQGRGHCLRLAGLGCDIVILDRNLKSFEVYEFSRNQMTAPTVVDECQAAGVKAVGVQVDLTDREATRQAISRVVEKMGRMDILVCNAGGGIVKFADEIKPDKPGYSKERNTGVSDVHSSGTPSDCPQETLTRVIDLNLMTCIYTCMAAAPYMKAQRSGKIITVASGLGIKATVNSHPYGTAKAAIIYYTRALAQELGPYNINVNCLVPGIIDSGRHLHSGDDVKHIPLGRFGTIEDCSKIIEFFATDLSDYVTGQAILVDGGLIN
jgi:3-oxoacyl-[acyl-carrier protein] reductase